MITDEFIKSFPALLERVMNDRRRESDEQNVTSLTVALMQSHGLNDAVDKALYLYERMRAGLRKETAQDVVNATGENRVQVPKGVELQLRSRCV